MSQAIKKQEGKTNKFINYKNNTFATINDYITNRKSRKIVLNYLFRHISFINNNNKIRKLTDSEYHKISFETEVSTLNVKKFIESFYRNLTSFKLFLKNCKIKHYPKNINRRVRIYLHKVYRLAPVFDYNRARKNLEILHNRIARKSFWPQITTQIAIIVYITDKNDMNNSKDKKVLQKNIRTLCNCSAYAFHRTRNVLEIN